MSEVERTVGLVAVGVDKTGVLNELKGAATGAKAIADWLSQQEAFGVKTIIHLFTDQADKIVRYQDIKKVTQQLVDDGGLDLLILYFSGHGIVKNGSDEQLLLSEVHTFQNEAINIASTYINSKHSNIKHVLIISDACRNAVDPYDPSLGQISGAPAFIRKKINGVTPSKVDIFYATEPSQTAKELRGEGFFTKILLEALYECPKEIYEKQLDSDMFVIKPWNLENYLNDQVPMRAYLETPSFEQVPEITTTSRDPLFLGFVLPKIIDKNFYAVNSSPLKAPFETDFKLNNEIRSSKGRLSPHSVDSKSNPFINKNIAFKEILEKINTRKLDGIPTNLLFEAGIKDEVNEYIELERSTNALIKTHQNINTGYHIIGEEILDIITNSVKVIKENIKEKENFIYIDSSTSSENCSIIVILKSGTFIVLPLFQNYIGTVHIENGLTKSISLTLKISKFHNPYNAQFESLSLRRACVAAFASNGKLGKIAQEDQFNFAHFIRRDKRIDPTLGIYASYAYTLSSDQKSVSSIYDYFKFYQNDTLQEKFILPFDIAFLANKDVSSKKFITTIFPMMSLGWSLLDSYIYKDKLNPLILDLGKRRLNAEWSTFSVDNNLDFINAFTKGHF